MKHTKPNDSSSASLEARTVKEITEPAKSISNKISVKTALEEMQARAIDWSPVTDERGKLLGSLSKNKMNRNVGGLGHDPRTEPVEQQVEENCAYCCEDQTITEAEQIMLKAKVAEVPVVTCDKLLIGKINIDALRRRKTEDNDLPLTTLSKAESVLAV
jgi:CBS domain-containing protein